jgi:hypothetical protein
MGQIVSDVTEILEYQDAKKAAKSERKEILKKMAADEAEKTNLVNKALATQRAKYGASGMSGNGITEGAVLKRLKSEVSAPYEEKRQSNIAKLKKTKAKNVNLLEKILSRFDDIAG